MSSHQQNNRFFFSYLVLVMISNILSSCQTPVLEFHSIPEGAEVVLFDANNRVFVRKGKTPIVLKGVEFTQHMSYDEPLVRAVLTKPGFLPENILINKDNTPKTRVFASLKSAEQSCYTVENKALMIRKLANDMYWLQENIEDENYAEVLRRLDLLIEQYEKVPYFLNLKGSVNILLGEQEAAIAAYKQSLAIEDNEEIKKILENLANRSPNEK